MAGFYRWLAGSFGGLGFLAKVALIVAITVLTTAAGMAIIVWLPDDYFSSNRPRQSQRGIVFWLGRILKNAVGWVLFPLGVVMALPLVPGPGLVFMLIGLSLLDFPGKRRLERAIVSRASVLTFLNNTRARFGKPALLLD